MKDEDIEGLDFESIAQGIESMEIRGAALIARAAAVGIRKYSEVYVGDDVDEFKNWLMEGKERLKSTRPTAVSLNNALNYVCKTEGDDVDEVRSNIKTRAERFVRRSHEAAVNIAEYGGKRINEGDTILTHCNSSLAIGAIVYAWEQGKKINVIATESRPKLQGLITVRELAEMDIPVTLIVDSAVRYFMQKVDQVYVGADTVASNGAVINKIGTSQIALCADEARVPLTVCAESYKFSKDTVFGEKVEIEERDPSEIVDTTEFPGVKVRNPVFDATPPDYIDAIITEEGVISPSSAYRIIKDVLEG